MTLHPGHDVLSVSWKKYPSIVFCWCHHVLLRDRWQILCLFQCCCDCPESVNQKNLNHLLTSKAHLCSAGRSEAGGGEPLGVFLVDPAQKPPYFTPDWKGGDQAGTSSAPLSPRYELFLWQAFGLLQCPKEHQRWGPSHSWAVSLPRELICTKSLNLKDSRKTEQTLGIKLVFIHSALVLTRTE